MSYDDDFEYDDFSAYNDEQTLSLRDWQRRAKKFFFDCNGTAIFEVSTGAGKCFASGTKIMMFDGSIKNIENIIVGDNIMGDDSQPRLVTSLASGNEEMYDIVPVKGKKYTVNKSHVLSLKYTTVKYSKKLKDGTIKYYTHKKSRKKYDISLIDYLKTNKHEKHLLKGYRVPIEFKKQSINIDPYWLGLWLGDGNSHNTSITNPEPFIINYIKKYALKLNMHFSTYIDKRNNNSNGYCISKKHAQTNKLIKIMKNYNIINNKHIPKEYLINDRETRLQLLAGLLDTDGYMGHNGFEVIQKSQQLIEDILFLVRSLGFAAYCSKKIGVIKKINFRGEYYRVNISGDCSVIPTQIKRKQAGIRLQKKDVLMTGIKVNPIGVGKYYGFTLSGNNKRFLLEDFTVVHNTFSAIDIIQDILFKEPDLKVLIVVPKNVILETGWYKELVDAGIPIQKIGVFYGDIKEYAQITVTNMQSLDKIPLEIFDMLIIDEVHTAGTKRMLEMIKHPMKYNMGLTATLKRMDNKHFDILKLFNYNVFKYTPREALMDGVLNPFVFFNIGVKMDILSQNTYDDLTQQLNSIFKASGSYEKIMRSTTPIKFKMLSILNERKALVNNYVEKFSIAREIIKHHLNNKIIVFNQFNAQTSKLYWHLLDDKRSCRVVHSGISKEKREKALIDFKNDKFNVLLTSKVLDEGYNLPKLDVAIIMAGDSTDKQTIQRMGRVLRKKKGQDSMLYQIYCINTMEERNAEGRAKIFKNLASDYKDIQYTGHGSLNL